MNKSKHILWDLFYTFFKIGAFTFGGGYAMISLLDRECVENKNWITSDELMNITVIAESTPGPIAINCATYTGYKLKGLFGSIIATFGMILPSSIIIFLISMFFENILSNSIIRNAFKGISVAICILITQAAIKMITKSMKNSRKKLLPIVFIVPSFLIVFSCNLFAIHFSTIYLIFFCGFIGYFVYGKKVNKSNGGIK
ncbi:MULTISPECIES: chromate transporter [Lacrimispora]|jgi:chromate transporter|uniref:chromate transporter n=1 Tax=Lacrimispora TaxID=2719231 RepID=UPI000BE42D6B|nr:chromate transporter [Lacrimispora amygdalina]MDK2966234.1 chromate transporter [Lacrimispora sp.]